MVLNQFLQKRRRKSLYDMDFHRWTEEQASALREQRSADIDWDNVAEEIGSLGKSEKRSIESNLNVVLLHLLKWAYQGDQRKPGWRSSIAEHRQRLLKLVDESPSLRGYPELVLAEEYRLARVKAADETGLPEHAFPESCPFSIAQVLNSEFWPTEPKPRSAPPA